MATMIYGQSDDLIQFEGDVMGEVNCYKSYEEGQGMLIFCDDATVLETKYGKDTGGIWEINVVRKGSLFNRLEICDDENVYPYSDIVYFSDGLKFAYAASEWEVVE